MVKSIKHQEQGAIVQILAVIILIVGIVFTIAVVTNPNLRSFIFKSRATNPPITFKDASGNPLPPGEGGLPVTTSTQVQIELEAPEAP